MGASEMTVDRSGPAAAGGSAALTRTWLILVIASFASFLGGFNQSTINVALPVMSEDLGSGSTANGWILLAYPVGLAGLILVFGRLADMVGRRRVFLSGMAVFLIASVVAALAGDPAMMIVGRLGQGAGGAMIFSTGAAMIAAAYPRARLGAAIGIYFAVNAVAQILGPVLGGVITVGIGWQWLFWINIPVIAMAYAAAMRVLPRESRAVRGQRLDWAGGALSIAVVASAVSGLSMGNERGWADPLILLLAVTAVLSLSAFVWWELRAQSPLLDLSLFSNRVFLWANISSFLICAVRFPLVLLIALMFQTLHSMGPAMAGVLVVPLSVGAMVASSVYGIFERWFSHYALGVASSLLTVVGVLLFLPAVSGSAFIPFAVAGGFVVGVGTGVLVTANGSAIMLSSPPEKLGVVSGARSLMQMLGNVVGVAGCLVVVAIPLPVGDRDAVYGRGGGDGLDPAAAESLASGFQLVYIVLAVVALAGAAASAAARDRRHAPAQGELAAAEMR